MAKDLEYYLAQARRIEAHREASFEKEIKKTYTDLLHDLRGTLSDAYTKWGTDDQLTFADLQKAGYDARFLQEIQQRVDVATKMQAARLQTTVREAYELAYKSMVEGVEKAAGNDTELKKQFKGSVAIRPEQIKAAVNNPVAGLTLNDRLEKKRKDIVYTIKQTVGVGLMNGDRYTTMAKRIAEDLDGDYKKAIRIARTETHRVREAGNVDAAHGIDKVLQDNDSGLRLVKTWKTMKDERVRPQQWRKSGKGWKKTMGTGANHIKMDGQTVLADEPFELGNGVTADAPGQSGVAAHDINCRCIVVYEMMDDAQYFKKTGKNFPNSPEKKALAEEQDILDQQSAAQAEADAAQAEMNDLDQEQFYNIWKDPVTAKDYEKLKDRLPAKRDYFTANGRQDMLDLCDEFEEKGKRYLLAKNQFDDATKRLDALSGDLKEARKKLMAIKGIDPDKIKQEIKDLQDKVAKLQSATGKKISLQTKVKNYDKEQLKAALKEADPYFEDSTLDLMLSSWSDDTVKKLMEDTFYDPLKQAKFKQALKKQANAGAATDAADLARMQKLLQDKQDEFAAIAQRYGLEDALDDKFSQKRKDAAYWFTGYDARERGDKLMRPDSGAVWQTATYEERVAANRYTEGSGAFNRPLRGYEGSWYNYKGPGKVDLDYEGQGKGIKRLTDLIDRSPSNFDIWLQRGVEDDRGAAGFLGISESEFRNATEAELQKLIGTTVTDLAFVSTAGAKGDGFSGPLILNIYAPKGTKMIYAEPFSYYGYDENGSRNYQNGINWDGVTQSGYLGGEFEVLLQRGTQFRITKVEKSGYQTYMDVEIVGQI